MFMASPPASARRFGPAIGHAALARLTWVYLRAAAPQLDRAEEWKALPKGK